MKTIHTLTQGSSVWRLHRATYFNASEAAAASGVSEYQTRTDLLKQKATGLAPEIDEATQARFARGHEFEAAARPWAEEIIGDALYPITASDTIDGLPLSASYDGATMGDDIIFEHKTLNKKLSASLSAGVIPDQYKPQMEQQLLILGASKCLFMASAGDKEAMQYAWYESDPVVRAGLLASWKQFQQDLVAYQHVETTPTAVAEHVESLPAVSVRMDGAIAVISNLDVFGYRLKAFVAEIDMSPATDQAFANCEAAVKTLQKAEDALDQAESAALAQIDPVEALRRTVADYKGLARTTRLAIEKLVKFRKESIRVEIVTAAQQKLQEHLNGLSQRIGGNYLPAIRADFAGAIKGKRTIESLRNAVDTELARAKIEASAVADLIELNRKSLMGEAHDWLFLFTDFAQVGTKAADDFAALVALRVSEHQAREAKRIEAERERIRAEELAKLAREQAGFGSSSAARPEEIARQAGLNAEARRALDSAAMAPARPISTRIDPTLVAPKKTRPSDDAIIAVLAEAFNASQQVVLDWLLDMHIFMESANG